MVLVSNENAYTTYVHKRILGTWHIKSNQCMALLAQHSCLKKLSENKLSKIKSKVEFNCEIGVGVRCRSKTF